jgi:hypothetical protein
MSAFITRNRGVIPKGVDGGRTRMTEAEVPQVNRGSKGSMGSYRAGGCRNGVKVIFAVAAKQHTTRFDIPNGKSKKKSNSIKQLLSRVNCLTDKRLLIKAGTTRTLFNLKVDVLVGRVELPRHTTGIV